MCFIKRIYTVTLLPVRKVNISTDPFSGHAPLSLDCCCSALSLVEQPLSSRHGDSYHSPQGKALARRRQPKAGGCCGYRCQCNGTHSCQAGRLTRLTWGSLPLCHSRSRVRRPRTCWVKERSKTLSWWEFPLYLDIWTHIHEQLFQINVTLNIFFKNN